MSFSLSEIDKIYLDDLIKELEHNQAIDIDFKFWDKVEQTDRYLELLRRIETEAPYA